jgi:hypothetical protein
MKYYIVGKKIKEGTLNSDSEDGDLSEYFELGWEYMVSHLWIKNMFSNGELGQDDVIVTLEDRMFLYQGFWHNVISYEEFINKEIGGVIVDLCDLIKKTQLLYMPKVIDNKYEHFDKPIITNIKYKNIDYLDIKEPYCCLHIRYRKWAEDRNLSKEVWKQIISSLNIKIYVFGKGAAEFADGKNIIHVSLEEYAALLHNSNCKFLIGNMSGGSLVAQTFSHKNCINYVIITDEKTHKEFLTENEYQIFYHIEAFNFSGAPIKYVTYQCGIDNMVQEIKRERQMTNAL